MLLDLSASCYCIHFFLDTHAPIAELLSPKPSTVVLITDNQTVEKGSNKESLHAALLKHDK